jgi:serine/threonine-protein kinase RsbW
VAQEAGFAEEDTFRLGMAVREAMVNAVVHGNRYSANKQVLLTVARTAGAIQVQIEDEGGGLDVGSVPDPLAEENLMKQSGRGLMLIQAFVDGFEVRPRRPAGTVVVLTKRLPPG